MNYRFEISLPNSSDFRCEIAIKGEQTFQQLHNKIVDALGYDDSQMASFYTLDKMGNRVKEIALMDMAADEGDGDGETLVMDSTKIESIINASCIELEYVFDFFNNKYFRVEYAGEYIADSADVLPVCLSCDGDIPEQTGFDMNDKWEGGKSDDGYDDSFMEEFSSDFSDDEEDDFNDEDEDVSIDDDDDDFGGGRKGRRGDRYESIDDYIDRL